MESETKPDQRKKSRYAAHPLWFKIPGLEFPYYYDRTDHVDSILPRGYQTIAELFVSAFPQDFKTKHIHAATIAIDAFFKTVREVMEEHLCCAGTRGFAKRMSGKIEESEAKKKYDDCSVREMVGAVFAARTRWIQRTERPVDRLASEAAVTGFADPKSPGNFPAYDYLESIDQAIFANVRIREGKGCERA